MLQKIKCSYEQKKILEYSYLSVGSGLLAGYIFGRVALPLNCIRAFSSFFRAAVSTKPGTSSVAVSESVQIMLAQFSLSLPSLPSAGFLWQLTVLLCF